MRTPSHPGRGAAVVTSSASLNATNVHGVVHTFGTLSRDVVTLPELVAKAAGVSRAKIMIQPGAFDAALSRIKVGKVEGSVQIWFGHAPETKTASTISGAMRLVADETALHCYVSSSSRDGANTVRWVKTFSNCREMSLCFLPSRFACDLGKDGASNILVVLEASITEVSFVPQGLFPKTSVTLT
jgi:phage head maturation protease